MVIYGAECSKPSETLQRAYSAKVKNTISNHCNHKDNNITYITSSGNNDLDIETAILWHRISLFRRATIKRPKLRRIAEHVLVNYTANDYNGTNTQQVLADMCEVSPLPGHPDRKQWAPFYSPFGPIGLLLVQLHEKATALGPHFTLHDFGWPSLEILDCPYAPAPAGVGPRRTC